MRFSIASDLMYIRIVLGPNSATIPGIVLKTFLNLEAFKSNKTSDWLNRMV